MIRAVTIRKFKRFEEETFDVSGHVILAGPNNCGKTTVLQAIAAWALGFKRWKELNDFQRHGGAYTKAPIARQAFSAVPVRAFDLIWKDRTYTGMVEIGLQLADGRRMTMEFHRDSTEQIYVRPKNDIEPAVVRNLALDVVYVAAVGGLSFEEPVYQPDYIQTLLGRQRPGDVVRNLLSQAAQGARWDRLQEAVKRLFGVELLVPESVGGQIISEYQPTGGGARLDILSAGSGFQQVVLLLACLFTRSGSVVLVDEPDAHLHVFLQDTIFAELHRAAAETNSQLVIASHSEVIFNSAAPEQICVMMGKPRRLASGDELERLKSAVAVLQQSDLVAALESPGILYLEGYTDLNLLREWARVLGHPLGNYFNRQPFWRGMQHPVRAGGAEVPPKEHFEALKLVNPEITGIWLVDADGKARGVPASEAPVKAGLNRIRWRRYETESYLVHPGPLARFIDQKTGGGGEEAVRRFLTARFEAYFGAGVGVPALETFLATPHAAPAVERFLADKDQKARTVLLGGILQGGGVHGLDYTRFNEIAALMLPEEIHPEVKEKLDFIQQAFGL
ncbi:ATPase AAA [Verrucomicrobiota bacterium]|nr:ATPase AAA [Verrucomicrobiota bacterium]